MTFKFVSAARVEFLQAIVYHELQRPGLGDEFNNAIYKAIREITDDPKRFPEIAPNVRRMLVDRFSYAVVYMIADDTIRILAVAHTARRPGYWRRRRNQP